MTDGDVNGLQEEGIERKRMDWNRKEQKKEVTSRDVNGLQEKGMD